MLLIHGVTASHLSWPFVAERLAGVRVIAPDLRGRGRSNGLADPPGWPRTPRDLVAVLDALGVERAVVVGHSMGAFVALVLGDLYPERVSRVVLVDGGLPLDLPDGPVVRRDHHARARTHRRAAGDAVRVRRRVPRLLARAPAFRRDWTPELEAYLAYDLVGEEPELRPATSYATLEEDSIDQNTGTAIVDALARLRHPTVLLTAERGLLDQVPAAVRRGAAARPARRLPGPAARARSPDVNHYTIAMSERGADAVAAVVREQLGRRLDA